MTTATDCATEHQVSITGVGSINGVSYRAKGSGSGDASKGRWDFSVAFSEVPRNVDPFANLLGILILPTAIFGREHGDATNLLTLANGVLEFTQILRGDEIAVDSVGTIRQIGERQLSWESAAQGDIRIPELASVEPFDAAMLPQGHGKISEVFALPFVGATVRGVVHAIRHFTFTPRVELRQVQFRRIAILSNVHDKTVTVKTSSVIRTLNAPFRSSVDTQNRPVMDA